MFDSLLLLAQSSAVEGQWSQLVSGLDQGQRFVLLIIGMGCVTGIILGIAGMIYCAVDAMHRRRTVVAFKREMIERGMIAEEIERVVQAATPEDITARMSSDAVFGRHKAG